MHGTPSPSRWQRFAHAVVVVLGGVGFALATFLVLPLLEAISATPAADLTVVSIDTAALAPPPPPPEVEQEPEKPPEQPQPPALADEAPPLDLAQLEMALDPGFGSAAAAGDFAIRIPGIGPGAADQGVDEMFSLADLDQKPRAIVQQQPALTAALKKKMPATVYVLFTVDTDGRVENPVVQSSSDPAFEAPALAAIKQWKFEPGKRSGQPVRFRMRQPMSFQ
jgi:periplasmic protein TonB